MNVYNPPCAEAAPGFESVWDETPALQETHERLQSMSFDQYCATMPDLRGFDADTTLKYIDMQPQDADPSAAIVVPFPFATGLDPHLAARMEMIQAAAPAPTRLIAFPNTNATQPTISVDKSELRRIANGDFTPYSDRVFRTLEHLGITSMHLVGYSQGAAIGGHMLSRMPHAFDVKASGIFEPPNLSEQSLGRLTRSFLATGMGAVHQAIEMSQVPWLGESIKPGNLVQNVTGLLSYARVAITGANGAIARGMAHHSLVPDMFEAVSQGTPLTLARAEHSTVTPADPFNKLVTELADHFPDRVDALEVTGVGHEMGDNIVLHGVLAAIALRKEPVT